MKSVNGLMGIKTPATPIYGGKKVSIPFHTGISDTGGLSSGKLVAPKEDSVHYDSQSRFTAAFKTYFKILPKEYHKKFPS